MSKALGIAAVTLASVAIIISGYQQLNSSQPAPKPVAKLNMQAATTAPTSQVHDIAKTAATNEQQLEALQNYIANLEHRLNELEQIVLLNQPNHEEFSAKVLEVMETKQQQELEKLIGEFHLEHVRKSQGMSVSGGERRRCEIARALAADPKFILLDEPFAGVDPISVGDIKDVILTLKNRGIGVLITDHNVRDTLAICEKAYIVSEGAIIAEGTSAEVLENDLVKSVYLGKDFQV